MSNEADAHLLRDLAIEVVHRELRPVYRVRERQAAQHGVRGRVWDFVPRAGKDNLAQAIILRLLTPRGELSELGHPSYGSRLHELVGAGNTSRQLNLLKLFILEALKLEPRIEKVTALRAIASPGSRSTVDVALAVKPRGESLALEIGPLRIELGI
jgi:phage baseplate assembly protein W